MIIVRTYDGSNVKGIFNILRNVYISPQYSVQFGLWANFKLHFSKLPAHVPWDDYKANIVFKADFNLCEITSTNYAIVLHFDLVIYWAHQLKNPINKFTRISQINILKTILSCIIEILIFKIVI